MGSKSLNFIVEFNLEKLAPTTITNLPNIIVWEPRKELEKRMFEPSLYKTKRPAPPAPFRTVTLRLENHHD